MTARVAALGTVARQFTLGVRSLGVGVYQNSEHHGYAKLRLVTRNSEGALVTESEPVMASTRYDYLEVMQIILRKQDIYPGDRMLGID
jgi:hypothetical protein